MDLIDYSEATFNKIKQDYLSFTDTLDLHDICFIPLSALDGDNVVNRSEFMFCSIITCIQIIRNRFRVT